MSYQVLARKWRPKSFAELAGQTEVLAALVHSLNEQRLHHAYLFTGTRGVGKTTVARIVAKCLNCERAVAAEPCNECQNCLEINEGRFVDLIEIDAASRTKVEDTREILDNIQYAPSRGRFKVYLIDEVHMLSTHSFNALLKTLEEPPEHVKFLLATTDPQKLPVTVLSRCLQFHLKNIEPLVIAERLTHILNAEKIDFELEAVTALAKAGAGSLRDALSLLDQAINQGAGALRFASTCSMLGILPNERLYELADLLVKKDNVALFQLLDSLNHELIDYEALLNSMLELWYEIALAQQIPSLQQFEYNESKIKALSATLSAAEVQLFYQICLHAKRDLALAPSPALGFKMLMLRLLSFYPLELNTGAQEKSTPTQNPAPIKSIAPTPKKPESAAQISPTLTPTTAPAAATTKASSIPTPKALHIENWAELINQLALKGLAKQLARHLNFIKQSENQLNFTLAHTHQASLNSRLQNELRLALSEYFSQEVILHIDLDTLTDNSPAAQQVLAEQAQTDSVLEKLKQDPHLETISNNFNATISNIKTFK